MEKIFEIFFFQEILKPQWQKQINARISCVYCLK
jgi:hypothetical protein